MKRVLLLIVDALSSRIVLPALERGELPHLAELVDRGQLAPESVAIFPSITPAATASLATGSYPAEHGISGAYWYDEDADEIAYYGDDFWVIAREGFGKFFDDFLVRLNVDRLRSETAFEIIERNGLSAACVNYLWFRGLAEHEVHTPWLLRIIPGVASRKPIPGPGTLVLGDFIAAADNSRAKVAADRVSASGGAFHRFGFDDAATADYLLHLIRGGDPPDFTLAYFPDNDFESHRVGPAKALQVVKQFDKTLGRLFTECGGCAALLDKVAVVITGDHSQSDIVDDDSEARIALDELLSDFALAAAGQPWNDGDELMVCPNMRAAQIYFHHQGSIDRDRLIEIVLRDERLDQAIWRDEVAGAPEFHVTTADRGSLRFQRGGKGEQSAIDTYGTTWSWSGALSAVDGHDQDGKLAFGDYPNAFERIAGAFFDQSGDLWLTARPGYAFAVPGTKVHPRGSHGSLHALDSLSPLIVSGAPLDLAIPANPRSVDVLPVCLRILGIERRFVRPRRRVGEGRMV